MKISQNFKNLLFSFFSLTSLKAGQILIPIITLPYLVQTIGLHNFGLVSFATSLSLYFGSIIQFGFRVTGTRDIARSKNLGKTSEIYSLIMSTSIFLTLICAIFYLLIIISIEEFRDNFTLYFIVFLFVSSESLFPVWLFQGIEKMKFITYIILSSKVLFMFSLLLFINNEDDLILYTLLNLSFSLISLISALLVIRLKLGIIFKVKSVREIYNLIYRGKDAFFIQFAPNMYNNSAIFILGIFTNNATVGLFSAATRMVEVFMSIGKVVTNVFLPYFSKNLKRHNQYLILMTITGMLMSIFLAIFSDFIALFFYDNIEVARYITLLSPWVFMIFTRNAIGVNYLMLIGYEKIYSRIISYTSIFGLVLCLGTIPKFKIEGAISVIILSSFIMLTATFLVFIRVKSNEKG